MPRTILWADEDGSLRKVKGYSLQETAELFEYHPDTVRRRVKAGLWPHVYVGRLIYFTEEQVSHIAAAQAQVYPAHGPGGY
jgi:predicted Zn-dependent peptidase